jgi:hypothetical protein
MVAQKGERIDQNWKDNQFSFRKIKRSNREEELEVDVLYLFHSF